MADTTKIQVKKIQQLPFKINVYLLGVSYIIKEIDSMWIQSSFL